MSTSPKPVLDFRSYQPGYTWTPSYTLFRLFSPDAHHVEIEIWDSFDSEHGKRYAMEKAPDGFWNARVTGNHAGQWYAYHIIPPDPCPPEMESYLAPVSDPWSKHVATKNHYLGYSKSLIEKSDEYDWEGDSWLTISDPRDLIIYEAHIKDFTADSSSDAVDKGSYKGFLQAGIKGGIPYLKQLGVNAVEFLPLHKAARFEPPYMETTASETINNWNYYGRNHWGYMTSNFFAPETLYASGESTEHDAVSGLDTRARNELRDVIKELHKNGIAVFLDVVYNHVSQYDLNPLKFASKGNYFRLDDKGHYRSESGCGNDSKTEHPEFRRLIVESIKYWMTEYHIDGFRFDLAHLIDWETIDEITLEARRINPSVVLIAEPWGGGYDPIGFSKRGWLAWNDQIRNGIKGSDPIHTKGFIFGYWHHETNRGALENYLKGTILGGGNGRFETSRTSLNYLESHDGYTLGDFIRIGLDPTRDSTKTDRSRTVKLDDHESKISRLAALTLFISQGVTMIHQGQEFGRSKWIVEDEIGDPDTGKLDHNSYEKDNATNFINYTDIDQNIDLFNYYQGLIAIRANSPALRKSHPDSIFFASSSDPLLVTAIIDGASAGDIYNYVVILNGNILIEHEIDLPNGNWELIAAEYHASKKTLAKLSGRVIIPPTSGSILRQRR